MRFFTYLLIDPRTNLPFYIGKGTKKRDLHHEWKVLKGKAGNNPHLLNKIRKIKSLGFDILYEKWFESDDEWFCYWMEAYLIDYFGRENLCNLTDGGEGANYWKGKKRSEEDRAKFRKAHLGVKLSEQHADNIAKALFLKEQSGENNGYAKFSETTIFKAFRLREKGLLLKQISQETGISISHLSSIFRGHYWSHLYKD
jgi:hypothetical protein